ncbi:hypothetical protein [Nostoc sp.]|uniref:hypothetical protein n=1 Tax=Nostoc sp. TaxID=1180 RepID=UPI003FA525A0
METAAQGQFWLMHDLLFTYQKALRNGYLVEYADVLVYSRLQLSEVQIIVRAQHCCAPTCVPHLPEKRCINGVRYFAILIAGT